MNIRNYRRQRLAFSIIATLVAAQLPLAYAQDAAAPASDEQETSKQVTTLSQITVRAQKRVELLQEPIDPAAVSDVETASDIASANPPDPEPQVETDAAAVPADGATEDVEDDDPTGHVIEFAALREEDLDPRD